MSLNRAQMEQTGADLRRNLATADASSADLEAWLELSAADVMHVLAMDGAAAPETVWLVRDAIDALVRERGLEPAWSVLTDDARVQGQQWFRLDPLPPRPEKR